MTYLCLLALLFLDHNEQHFLLTFFSELHLLVNLCVLFICLKYLIDGYTPVPLSPAILFSFAGNEGVE